MKPQYKDQNEKAINTTDFVNKNEMEEINNNTELNDSIQRGLKDIRNKSGRFI